MVFVILALCLPSSKSKTGDSRPCTVHANTDIEIVCRKLSVYDSRPLSLLRLRGGSRFNSFENTEAPVLDFSGTHESIIEDHAYSKSLDSIYKTSPRSHDEAEALKEESSQEEAMRQSILSRILSKEARSRLGNIATVKPDRARKIEDTFIEQARCGMILQQVSEDDLIKTVDRITTKLDKRHEIRFARRKSLLDSLGLDPELAQRLGVKVDGWNAENWDDLHDSDKDEWGDDLPAVGCNGAGDAANDADEGGHADQDGEAADIE